MVFLKMGPLSVIPPQKTKTSCQPLIFRSYTAILSVAGASIIKPPQNLPHSKKELCFFDSSRPLLITNGVIILVNDPFSWITGVK